MEKKIKIGLVSLLLLVAVLGIYIYQTQFQKQIEIIGEQKVEVLQYTNPIVDNLLEGFNEENYTMFSRDFDEQMKNTLPENAFLQTCESIISKIGVYISMETSKVLKHGPYTVVIYKAEFEKEKGVEVKVVFQRYGERNLVSGLWFNSPKLRK